MMPRRILMTADAVGGVWTYALDLAEGLREQRTAVTLAVCGPSATEAQQVDAAARGLTLVDTGEALDWTASSPAQIQDAGGRLAALADDLDVDLVHLNSPALAAEAVFRRPVVGVCHSCVATWWQAVKDAGPLPADFQWRTALQRRGLLACDALIAPSRAFAQAVATTYGVAAPQVALNGRAPAQLPAVSRERMVFTAGRLWDEGKNARTLDLAARQLDAPFLAAGPTRSPLGDTIHLQGLTCTGPLTTQAVTEHMGRARVFASAALYEPFGLGVLEAAQAGCALVLSDNPTFRELWSDAAVFVPARNAGAMADAIQTLLDDDLAWSRLSMAARQRAGRYTVEAMVAATLGVYRRAVEGKGAAA
jgi:glycogen(starch) synthase